MRYSYWGIIGCLLLGSGVLSAQLSATARLDTTEIMIGDQVNLQLAISYAPSIQLKKIDLGVLSQDTTGLEIVAISQVDTASRQPMVNLMQRFILTAFDSGYYRVPEIPVTYLENGQEKVVNTNELALKVNTIPIYSDTTDLQPIKDIIHEPVRLQDFLPYFGGGLGIVLLIALIVWLSRRNRLPEDTGPPPPPQLAAHEIAFQRLRALREAGLLQQQQFKEYQSRLTYLLREYLEGRFQIAALESTTEEIINALKRSDFPADWTPELREMLQKADLVKFAKAEPPLEFHAEALEMVARFVEATKAVSESEGEPTDDPNAIKS